MPSLYSRVYNWLSFLKINLTYFSVPKNHITHYPQTFLFICSLNLFSFIFRSLLKNHIKTFIIHLQLKLVFIYFQKPLTNTSKLLLIIFSLNLFFHSFSARPLRSVFPGASRPAAGRTDLPVLAHPRRGQLALARKVSRGRFAR